MIAKNIHRVWVLATLLMLSVVAFPQRVVQTESLKNSFKLQYELPLQQPKSDYAMVVTPLLCGVNDTLQLEPVTVRGGNNARKLHRDYVLHHKGVEPTYIKANEMPSTMMGEADISLSAYPWVKTDELTLCMRVEQEGCCEVQTLLLSQSAPLRYVTPYAPIINMVPDFKGLAAQLEPTNPVLEHISAYRPYDTTRILRKEGRLIYVNFPVNSNKIDRDFMENADRLDRIMNITRQIMDDNTSVIKMIQIIGLSSVEGSDAFNRKLAGERAEALKRYVQDGISLPDELFEVVNGGAAWTEFRDQVNDAEFEGKEQVLKIIDNTKDANRRQALIRQLMGGKPYDYIREHILPGERNAGYVRIYWDVVPDENAKVINRASELLQQQQWQEALNLLQTVRSDQRAYNALGVALYMTGQETEAMNLWRQAATAGNEDARHNLEQLQQ